MVAVREKNLATRKDADAIAEAVAEIAENDSRLKQHDFTAWKRFRELADDVELIDLSVVSDSLFVQGDRFAGPCNVVVSLGDDPDGEDGPAPEEVFPGKVFGHRDPNGGFVVDDIEVDLRALHT